MVRKTKWIQNSTPEQPVEEVARQAIEARLDLVWHYLPRAAEEPDEPENVHQLRVSSRRACAAMENFAELLPPRRALWINERLRLVRKAAGDARDLDVLAARLADEAGDEPTPAQACVLAIVARCRQEAQQPIDKIAHKLAHKEFSRRCEELAARIRLREKGDRLTHPTLSDAARRHLLPLVQQFFAAGEHDLSQYPLLHALRIAGKELRYAMEVFAGAFAADFRQELYRLVEQAQEKLGAVNDHATARQLFANWLSASESDAEREALAKLIDTEQEGLEQTRRDFLDWWTPERTGELQRRFQLLLGEYQAEQTA